MLNDYKLLKELCEIPGVPGYEHRVRDFIEAEIAGDVEYMYPDPMGNLVTSVGHGDRVVMVACHMDEIGFIVNHIDEKGFIYVQPLGGFDPRNLFSRRVLVCTSDGDFDGVMNPAGLPVHLSKPEDRKKVPDADEFIIDIGMDANGIVDIGDWVVMNEPFMEMGDKVVSKALDNRIACFLGIELLQNFDNHDNITLHVVFTTQEEVGLRGAKTSAFGIDPDVAIGVDVTLACDTPGVPANKHVTKLGNGFALGIRDASFISSPWLVDYVKVVADKYDIPYQKVVSNGGGMDGAAMQQAANGSAAVAISVGTRYIHTVTEMASKSDIEAAAEALVKTVNRFQ